MTNDPDEPDYLDPKALAGTLAACVEQLHHVRGRVQDLANGGAASADHLALLQTLQGVEALLTQLSESMANRH